MIFSENRYPLFGIMLEAKSGSISTVGVTVTAVAPGTGLQSRIGKIEQVGLPAEGAAQQQLGPRYPRQIVPAVTNSRADLAARRHADERQNPAIQFFAHVDIIAPTGQVALIWINSSA